MWDYSKNRINPDQLISGSVEKVWWKCPEAEDHEWLASPSDRFVRGTGCPFCAGRRISIANCIAVTHPSVAAEWHPTKNGGLTPKDVTRCSQKKAWFQCRNHPSHEWQARIDARTRLDSTGCPFCASSKGEAAIRECLEDYDISYVKEYAIEDCKHKRPLPFDFAVFDSDGTLYGLIEFQGRHHYESIKFYGGDEYLAERKYKDRIKKEYCEKNGIQFLEVPYTDIDNIDRMVVSFVLPVIRKKAKAKRITQLTN